MLTFFAPTVYFLCFAASALCAWLLLRSFAASRDGLLFWSGLCFLFLAANNFVVILDRLVVPTIDFALVRVLLALTAVTLLLFGLIWRVEGRS